MRITQWIGLILMIGVCIWGIATSNRIANHQASAATIDGKRVVASAAPAFVPSGARWEPVSRDMPDRSGGPITVDRIPLPSRDGWLYRCVSPGGVGLCVVPDENMRLARH